MNTSKLQILSQTKRRISSIVNAMTQRDELKALHRDCVCVMESTASGAIEKCGCSLFVDGLNMAIDCDKCAAFQGPEKRPDIVAIQSCDPEDELRWLVIEVKSTMRKSAFLQVRSGLEKLASNSQFDIGIANARAYFAYMRKDRIRAADLARMKLTFHGKPVPFRTIECGTTIPRQ